MEPIDWSFVTQDKRPQRGWWAPGEYIRCCSLCHTGFIGDKRAGHCADCAYGMDYPEANLEPVGSLP